MFLKHITLLCFLVSLPGFGNPNPQRSQTDANVRGNSFGLENFLFQSYENPEVKDAIRVVKTKRVRPVVSQPRITTNGRDQTYGLENLNVQLYESSRIKPVTAKPLQRRPAEPTAESNRIKETFVVKPEKLSPATQEPETIAQEIATERIRKRIMMRRRRKRPTNAAQSESNSEITGNAILKPVRIPVYPQIPKVVLRKKLPDENIVSRLPTVSVKTVSQTEKSYSVEATEQEEPTTVTEKSTTTTIKDETTITTAKPSTINLKTFLKQQTETLSLSELLQTQNLSLADLLRGNKDASAILKGKQAITSTTAATTTSRKQFNRVEPDQTEQAPEKTEVAEMTFRPNYSGFQAKISKIKTNEQANTKSVDENIEDTTKPLKRPVYTSSPTGFDPQNRLNELRTKLRNFQKKTNPPPPQSETTTAKSPRNETIESVPAVSKTTELPLHKKNRISFKSANNPELPLIFPIKAKLEQENVKRPQRLSNWTNRISSLKRPGQDRPKENGAPIKPLKVPILIEEDNKNSKEDEEIAATPKLEEMSEEDVSKPEPKDELIELLKSGPNASRLQKILNSRNMTIQELLDNREKPPLQTDIATLFSQQKPAPTIPAPTLFDSLPDFGLDDADEEPEAEESAPITAKVLLMPSREPKQYGFPVTEQQPLSHLNLQPDDLTADTSKVEDSALWKLSEKSMYYGSSYGYGNFPVIQTTEKSKSDLSNSDIIFLETVRRSQETNRKFKFDLNDFVREEEEPQTEDIEKAYIPPAVKSAIIASGVVMGIALFIFIAIFAACGWKQRQIRLKGSSSTLAGTPGIRQKSKRTMSPVSFKDSHSYKKTIDFDDETSESGTSHASSYLWSTLKNTFTSRASTLKSRLEKEKMREDKVTLRRNESRRKESRIDDKSVVEEAYAVKKIDRDRNVINTSFNFKRSPNNSNVGHFNECVHGY